MTVPDLDKGKGKEAMDENSDSESDSSFGTASDSSARSRRRRVRRRRRDERRLERLRQKHPGVHRPGCPCPSCVTVNVGPPCWSCFAPRVPPPGPMPPPPPPGVVVVERDRSRRRGGRHNHHNRHRRVPLPRTVSPPPPPGAEREPGSGNERIKGEDMRTWTLTLELNMDVYICANKFLMADFKDAIARCCIDMLETAGTDAAQPEVLRMCKKLHAGVPESDPLLKMLLARVGFLQPLLWKRAPDETSEFLHENPQVTALMLREMATRRDDDLGGTGRYLPSLERGWVPPSTPGGGHPGAPVHVFDPYGFHPHRPLPPHARPPRAVW